MSEYGALEARRQANDLQQQLEGGIREGAAESDLRERMLILHGQALCYWKRSRLNEMKCGSVDLHNLRPQEVYEFLGFAVQHMPLNRDCKIITGVARTSTRGLAHEFLSCYAELGMRLKSMQTGFYVVRVKGRPAHANHEQSLQFPVQRPDCLKMRRHKPKRQIFLEPEASSEDSPNMRKAIEASLADMLKSRDSELLATAIQESQFLANERYDPRSDSFEVREMLKTSEVDPDAQFSADMKEALFLSDLQSTLQSSSDESPPCVNLAPEAHRLASCSSSSSFCLDDYEPVQRAEKESRTSYSVDFIINEALSPRPNLTRKELELCFLKESRKGCSIFFNRLRSKLDERARDREALIRQCGTTALADKPEWFRHEEVARSLFGTCLPTCYAEEFINDNASAERPSADVSQGAGSHVAPCGESSIGVTENCELAEVSRKILEDSANFNLDERYFVKTMMVILRETITSDERRQQLLLDLHVAVFKKETEWKELNLQLSSDLLPSLIPDWFAMERVLALLSVSPENRTSPALWFLDHGARLLSESLDHLRQPIQDHQEDTERVISKAIRSSGVMLAEEEQLALYAEATELYLGMIPIWAGQSWLEMESLVRSNLDSLNPGSLSLGHGSQEWSALLKGAKRGGGEYLLLLRNFVISERVKRRRMETNYEPSLAESFLLYWGIRERVFTDDLCRDLTFENMMRVCSSQRDCEIVFGAEWAAHGEKLGEALSNYFCPDEHRLMDRTEIEIHLAAEAVRTSDEKLRYLIETLRKDVRSTISANKQIVFPHGVTVQLTESTGNLESDSDGSSLEPDLLAAALLPSDQARSPNKAIERLESRFLENPNNLRRVFQKHVKDQKGNSLLKTLIERFDREEVAIGKALDVSAGESESETMNSLMDILCEGSRTLVPRLKDGLNWGKVVTNIRNTLKVPQAKPTEFEPSNVARLFLRILEGDDVNNMEGDEVHKGCDTDEGVPKEGSDTTAWPDRLQPLLQNTKTKTMRTQTIKRRHVKTKGPK